MLQFPLPPERAARLLAEALLRVQGEKEGHPFHGNQWTKLGEAEFSDRFPPASDDPAPGRVHYYHATDAANLESIAREGIKLGNMAPISLSPHLDSAHFWGSNVRGPGPVLLRVKRRNVRTYQPEDPEPGEEYDPNDETAELATFRPIKPEHLEVYHKGKWSPLSVLKAMEAAGHPFHGNQYTGGFQGSTHFDTLAGLTVVGSSAARKEAKATLEKIPQHIREEAPRATIHAFKTQAEVTAKIDEYLLKHYGFTSEGQAKQLTDRDKSTIFTTAEDADTAFAHLFEDKIEDPSWQAATPDRSKEERERDFVNAFAELVTGKAAQDVMSFSNPLTAVLERKPVMDAFRRWGWA